MCTTISNTTTIAGAAKGRPAWFPVTQSTVAYDHATATAAEHALLIDFVNYDLGTDARVAIELDMASGKVLLEQLRAAIAAAEASGV